MARIAMLGLGAMGRRMAKRLVEAGHDLTLWNRSGVPPELSELHSRESPSPREAVAGAELTISMVTDDQASRRVWRDPQDGALAGLTPGALAIESSTISPAWASELGAIMHAGATQFLDAPVVGSRPQAEAGALVFLVGGAPEAVARAQPVFSVLGSAVHPMGDTPNGTIAKLAVNALFSAQVAMLAEVLEMTHRSGLDSATLLQVMATLPVMSPAAKAAGAAMCANRFEPMFPIALVVKDLQYAVASAAAAKARSPLTQGLREVFEGAAARGLGGENITAVAKLYRI